MNHIDQIPSMEFESSWTKSDISENSGKENAKEINILIRRVGMEDHLNIVKLFQVCSV